MPNGKPGDHPLTDILVHNMSVYSPRIYKLVAEIDALGGRDKLRRIDWWRFDPFGSPDLAELEQILVKLRMRVDDKDDES